MNDTHTTTVEQDDKASHVISLLDMAMDVPPLTKAVDYGADFLPQGTIPLLSEKVKPSNFTEDARVDMEIDG